MKIDADKVLFVSLVGTAFLLTHIPFIGKFFRLIDTMVHESAHAFMALLLSASVERIDLFANTEGQAVTRTKGRFAWIVISLAGYPGSSLTAFILFCLLYLHLYNIVLYVLIGFCLLNLVLWVRNAYGIFFVILFGALCGALVYFDNLLVIRCAAILFSSLLWMDALVSACIILYLSLTQKKNSGDAWNLQQSTYIPAFFWGLLFAAQAIGFSYLTLALYLQLPLPKFFHYFGV